MAFHFAKPADFQFRAGQSMDLTLLNPPETDAEGNSRAFSIASAPFDNDLMIATRMRDTGFKRVLRKASPGLQVKIDHPGGSFVLHLFQANLWAVASWLIFGVAHSLRIDLDSKSMAQCRPIMAKN